MARCGGENDRLTLHREPVFFWRNLLVAAKKKVHGENREPLLLLEHLPLSNRFQNYPNKWGFGCALILCYPQSYPGKLLVLPLKDYLGDIKTEADYQP